MLMMSYRQKSARVQRHLAAVLFSRQKENRCTPQHALGNSMEIKMEANLVPTCPTVIPPALSLDLMKLAIRKPQSCAAIMRCPFLSEGKSKGRVLISAICQIFMASFTGTIATMTTKLLQRCKLRLQGQAQTIALSSGTYQTVQCSKLIVMTSRHAQWTFQPALQQGVRRHSMKQDMPQSHHDAAILRWSSSHIARSANRASASATKVLFKAFCIGSIAQMMRRHMQVSKREFILQGLAYLQCAHGLVATVKLAHLWVTIALGLRSHRLPPSSIVADLNAGRSWYPKSGRPCLALCIV